MTEENLIKFLSDESEKFDVEPGEKCSYDTDLCGWKDSSSSSRILQAPLLEPARFRIRVLDNRSPLTKSASSKSCTGTVSSSNESRSASPKDDSQLEAKRKISNTQNRKRIYSINTPVSTEEHLAFLGIQPGANIIRIHKPPKPRRQRKPIKVFRLPRVEQGEGE